LSDAGYSLFLCNTDSNGDKQGAYVRALIEKGVDGVILDSVGFQAEQQVAMLEREGIPVVLLDCVVGRRAQRFGVFLDNAHGVREALTFLFHRPDRRLVFISGPADVSQSVDRRQGVAAFAAAGKLGPDRLSIVDGDFTLDCGFRVAAELLKVCRPGQTLPFNGIFAANDMMALGALKALRQAGIGVPGEVEVMGYDDIEFVSLCDPPLSTVAQPARDMGAASALLLLRLMNGEKPHRKTVVMKPRLVLRGTTLAQHPPKSGETDGEL
jgi:LacI family transcriptional regulator